MLESGRVETVQMVVTNIHAPRNIAAIVLAAGTSSRYGGANKLLLPFGASTVVGAAVDAVLTAGLTHLVVVTGHQRDAVQAALAGAPVAFTDNPRYREGEMLSSIKAGLIALDHAAQGVPCVDAALIALGDQPLLPPAVIGRLILAYERRCGEIIAPKFGAVRGHPVLIDRRWWPEVMALPDGTPMRELLRAHPEAVAHILVNTDAVIRDVDTPELYEQARAIGSNP
jgi:molybdenum cofactor cytidylyltransferase